MSIAVVVKTDGVTLFCYNLGAMPTADAEGPGQTPHEMRGGKKKMGGALGKTVGVDEGLVPDELGHNYIVVVYIVMAYVVMAYIVMASIVMAFIVMACIVMTYALARDRQCWPV